MSEVVGMIAVARRSRDVNAAVEVEAVRWDGSHQHQGQIVTWGGGRIAGGFDGVYFLSIENALSGERVDVGDWVVREGPELFRAYTPDAFAERYLQGAERRTVKERRHLGRRVLRCWSSSPVPHDGHLFTIKTETYWCPGFREAGA